MTKILVVEDDPIQRNMMRKLLTAYDFDVTTLDQFDALNWDWCEFDIVLVDVLMSVHDGPSLIRHAASRCHPMPHVVLYSALSGEPLQHEIGNLRDVLPCYYLTKTIDIERLVQVLREVVN